MTVKLQQYKKPFAGALLLHLGLFAIVFGYYTEPKKPPKKINLTPEIIHATAIDTHQVDTFIDQIKQQKLKRQRTIKNRKQKQERLRQQKIATAALKKKRDAQKAKRKAKKAKEKKLLAEKRKKQAEAAKKEKLELKKKTALKKRRDAQKTKRKAKKAKEKKLLAEKRKKQAEAAKKEKLELKKKTALKKRRDAQKAKRKAKKAKEKKLLAEKRKKQAEAARQSLVAKKRAAAKQAIIASIKKRKATTAINRAIKSIDQKVNANWTRPPSFHSGLSGLSCVIEVKLSPEGIVEKASIIATSGNNIFDRSAANAVRKASPLPIPTDPALFNGFRVFKFKFAP